MTGFANQSSTTALGSVPHGSNLPTAFHVIKQFMCQTKSNHISQNIQNPIINWAF